MKSANRRDALLLTIFVLVALALQACTASDTTFYALVSRDTDIAAGAEVKMRGDVVGQVSDVELAPSNQMLLTMTLPVEKAKLVPQDSQVQLVRKAIIVGDVYVVIVPGEGPALADGDTLQAQHSWVERQRARLGDTMRAIDNPEVREKLDEFRRELEAATRSGAEEWEELRPELEKKLAELHETAQETLPQIADTLYEQMKKVLEQIDRDMEN